MERKGILQFIKNCLNDPNYNKKISDNLAVTVLMAALRSDMYKHYEILDDEKYACHERRFFLLYIDDNGLTFEDMEKETFIGERGFKRWVRFYNKTALKIVMRKSILNPDYLFLLNEYGKSGL